MAVIYEKRYEGGGAVRVHDDYLPRTESERRAADLAFELTVARLIRNGEIVVPGYEYLVGKEIVCELRREGAAYKTE